VYGVVQCGGVVIVVGLVGGVLMSEASGGESSGDTATVTLEHVWGEIERLRERCARHRKKGFRITQLQPPLQSNHLIEEAVELQAELLGPIYVGRRAAIVGEAADTVVVLLHLLIQCGIEPDELLPACLKSLSDHWDSGEEKVR
jgi:hypothetical protein